ncbi:STAS domain protein [Thalassoglobus neptunius]|uniref:STAS domain protein n=1 Tax=Thalassoglobus neptunius TaxID=1938619 RepID=A0A5C5X438_9PLAN|nr:STAS domain-containing protein [Thalassoglobus neptunius]TWT56955.1 STAS domain protein [Thalassoglobus neptunius]
MQHLNIFRVEKNGDALVVTPSGEVSSFRYQDIHQEANTIRGEISRKNAKYLVLNLSELEYFGSEFIGSLVSMLRETRMRGGKGCFCAANDQMLKVLQNMSLFKLWPYFDTVPEALSTLNKSEE